MTFRWAGYRICVETVFQQLHSESHGRTQVDKLEAFLFADWSEEFSFEFAGTGVMDGNRTNPKICTVFNRARLYA